MSKGFLILSWILLSGCSSLNTMNSSKSPVISKSAAIALKNYDPNFSLWPLKSFMPSVRKLEHIQNPGLTSADFNGDKIQDYAVLGCNKSHEFLLAVVSQKPNAYKVYKIDRATKINPQSLSRVTAKNKREFGLWTYLSVLKPSKIKSKYEKNVLNFKNDALEVQYFEKGSLIYIFKNHKFQKYISTRN